MNFEKKNMKRKGWKYKTVWTAQIYKLNSVGSRSSKIQQKGKEKMELKGR